MYLASPGRPIRVRSHPLAMDGVSSVYERDVSTNMIYDHGITIGVRFWCSVRSRCRARMSALAVWVGIQIRQERTR